MSDAVEEICAGCDHPIALHFKDVREVVRCTNVESGTSSRGVIGIPYSHRCDCKNYVSESVQKKQAKIVAEVAALRARVAKSFRRFKGKR